MNATLAEAAVEPLNRLLRSSMVAREAYEALIHVLKGLRESPVIPLHLSARGHRGIESELGLLIERLGGVPGEAPAVGSIWAETLQEIASRFGIAEALRVLKRREEAVQRTAREAIAETDRDVGRVLGDKVLPVLEKNLRLLGLMIESEKTASGE